MEDRINIDELWNKDVTTRDHCKRVENRLYRLCNKLCISWSMVEKICLAGRYHDIGKVQIYKETLNKFGKLSKKELRIMEGHQVISYDLLRENGFNDNKFLKGVIYHHEKVDGTGDLGIDGKNIGIIAKMIAVVDVYDLKLDGNSEENKQHAILELIGDKGLDQEIVKEFIKII